MIFVNKYVDYDYNNYKRYLQTCYTEFFSQNEVLSEDIEKKRDVCINRLIGYVKEIIAFDEEVKRLNKEIKTRLSLIKLDSETYYDSLR